MPDDSDAADKSTLRAIARQRRRNFVASLDALTHRLAFKAVPSPLAQRIADAWGASPSSSETVVVDCESGRFRMGLAADLAQRMGAEHIPLEEVAASGLVEIITDRTSHPRSAA